MGASEKLERAKKKEQVGIGNGGAGAGEREEEGEPVRLSTFFTDPLPPTFVIYLDNWISAVKISIRQFTEIFFGFLAQVVRANPVREQVTIAMSKKKFLPISMSTLQSAADFTRKTLHVPEQRFDAFLYLVSPKSKN